MNKGKRVAIYQFVIIMVLFVIVIVSHNNYTEVLEVNEQMSQLLDEQRERRTSDLEEWSQSYDELQRGYGTLLSEYDKLSTDYDNLEIELIEKMNEVDIPVYDYSAEEIYMLAQCVEAEAGHFDKHSLSQRYVTQVILNRLHSSKFPNTIEGVIYQKGSSGVPQFSVAYNGMMNRQVELKTLINVYDVIVNGTDMPEYVCFFFSEKVEGKWVNTLPIYDVVQGTVFAYAESHKEAFLNE